MCHLAPHMSRCFGVVVLSLLACTATADDRATEYQTLNDQYQAEAKAFFEAPAADNMTTAEHIRRREAFPVWRYLPRFLKLAEAQPEDETAFQCCQWIIARDWNVLAWPAIYVLDRDGRIAAKDLQDADLDTKIKELLDRK